MSRLIDRMRAVAYMQSAALASTGQAPPAPATRTARVKITARARIFDIDRPFIDVAFGPLQPSPQVPGATIFPPWFYTPQGPVYSDFTTQVWSGSRIVPIGQEVQILEGPYGPWSQYRGGADGAIVYRVRYFGPSSAHTERWSQFPPQEIQGWIDVNNLDVTVQPALPVPRSLPVGTTPVSNTAAMRQCVTPGGCRLHETAGGPPSPSSVVSQGTWVAVLERTKSLGASYWARISDGTGSGTGWIHSSQLGPPGQRVVT